MSTQPNPNMTKKLVELVEDNWDSDNAGTKNLLIDNSSDLPKGRDLGTYDYIEMAQTSPLGIEYADLFMSSQNVDTVVYVELKSNSEARRDELFAEFRRIIEAHRMRPDTPGDYDKMIFQDITPLDDDNFGAHLYEIVVGFVASARSVGV